MEKFKQWVPAVLTMSVLLGVLGLVITVAQGAPLWALGSLLVTATGAAGGVKYLHEVRRDREIGGREFDAGRMAVLLAPHMGERGTPEGPVVTMCRIIAERDGIFRQFDLLVHALAFYADGKVKKDGGARAKQVLAAVGWTSSPAQDVAAKVAA